MIARVQQIQDNMWESKFKITSPYRKDNAWKPQCSSLQKFLLATSLALLFYIYMGACFI